MPMTANKSMAKDAKSYPFLVLYNNPDLPCREEGWDNVAKAQCAVEANIVADWALAEGFVNVVVADTNLKSAFRKMQGKNQKVLMIPVDYSRLIG